MTEGNKPVRLDAGIDDTVFNKEQVLKKKESKLLPYLLAALILLAGYYFITVGSDSGPGMELTPEQVEVQTNITSIVEEYVSRTGSLPDDPAELNLPDGSDIIMGDDGSWIVSTPDGQLIISEDALPPFEERTTVTP